MRLGRGELDSQSALELGSLIKQWIDSRRAAIELDLKIAAQGGGAGATNYDHGRFAELARCNIVGMGGEEPPRVNGHDAINGHGPDTIIKLTSPRLKSAPPEEPQT